MTTTNGKTYDLTAIMRRAWAIRRAAATKYNCTVSEIHMGECLRIAWAEAEGLHAADNAAAVVTEWAMMTDPDKLRFMTACVRRAAKNDIGYSEEDHYLQFDEVPAFNLHGNGFDEFVNETWLSVARALSNPDKLTATNERRAAAGKRPVSLVSIVYNAAHAAINRIWYADRKHGKATVRTIEDDKGNVRSYVEEMATSRAYSTETAAIIHVELSAFIESQDEYNRAIIHGLMQGYTEREIAATLPISNVAVHKRIVKMRDTLSAFVA